MSDFWLPDLNANTKGKQWTVFNSTARALLVAGPRYAAKTWAILHKIVRHLWDTPGASVAMFSKTMKNSKEGGTWLDLHRYTIPEWIRANIGLYYTTTNNEGKPGWRISGDTRTPFFRIRNRHGGESECRLFSLDYTQDIADKVKEQRFSMIYFSELQKFDDRIVLSTTMPCLRMPHLEMEQQQWLADCNPSMEGEQSWIYRVWFQERKMDYEEYLESCKEDGLTPPTATEFYDFRNGLELIEMFPEENNRLDPRVLNELKMSCRHDPGLYARDVEGKWVYGDGDSSRHFRAYFKPAVHVLGNCESTDEDEWLIIKPTPTSTELITGLDLGETNHAGVVLDSILLNNRKHFSILDELETIHQEVSIEDFTIAFMEIIEEIETEAGKKYNLDLSYSDRSSLEKYVAAADTYQHLEVRAASKGRLVLIGVPKASGSVVVRVKLVRQLLSQGRLKVSAKCKGVIRMLVNLKKGKGRLNFVVSNEDKHIFDALTYALLMECAEELESQENRLNVGKRSPLIVQV